MAMTAVLTFHDAVELFLEVAAEVRNAAVKQRTPFLDYFDAIADTGVALTGREGIRRLNTARVGLKHSGVLPDRSELDGIRASVMVFLEDNSHAVFGIDFHSLSMFFLVTSETIRDYLTQAEERTTAGDFTAALGHASMAFWYVRQEYKERKRPTEFRSPFPIKLNDPWNTIDAHIIEAVNKLGVEVSELQLKLDILTLGLDFREYEHFTRLVPEVIYTMNGQLQFGTILGKSEADCRFCIDFVLDAAIRLQADPS